MEEDYEQLQHEYENLKQSFEELLDLQDYNDGPYRSSSLQSLQNKITGDKSSSRDEDNDENRDEESSSFKRKGRKKEHIGSPRQKHTNIQSENCSGFVSLKRGD